MNEEKIKRYSCTCPRYINGGELPREHELNYIMCLDADVTALESQLPPDRWETVTEWEKRTGEKYPEDGPVWLLVYGEITKWALFEFGRISHYSPGTICIPRIGMGKPPEVINE